jgi:hypothetical protein
MEQEQHALPGERVSMVRGADDQLAALERLWTQGLQSEPQADEAACQVLRRVKRVASCGRSTPLVQR